MDERSDPDDPVMEMLEQLLAPWLEEEDRERREGRCVKTWFSKVL